MTLFVHTDIFLKLIIATILGMIIGLEREIQRKPLGLRTSIVIAVSSCLLTVVSIGSASIYSHAYSKPMDPLRLAAQIVSGVGFIGAGVILRKNNDAISGLTTAAMIWAASGIGIAVGAGFYKEAVMSMILIILSVELLPTIMYYLGIKTFKEKEMKVVIHIENKEELSKIINEIKKYHIRVVNVVLDGLEEANKPTVEMKVLTERKVDTTDLYQFILTIKGVTGAKIDIVS